MQTAKCFEVYLPSGVLLFRAYVLDREFPITVEPAPTKSHVSPSPGSLPEKQNGEAMTSSQRRFLFRLLALQGVEGERAEGELKRQLKVASLKDITKIDASNMIEQLLLQKGGNGNGSPVK